MAPIFWRITTTPADLVVALWIADLALSLFILWDGLRRRPDRVRRPILVVAQAIGFFVLAGAFVIALPMKVELPDPLILPLRSWGLFGGAGMIAGFLVQRAYAKAEGIDPEHVFSIWIYGGISGLFLGRALHVAVNFGDYAGAPLSMLMVTDGGLVWFGMLLGYLLFARVYASLHRLDFRLFDALALGLPLGHAFGRIGCFLAGCCWGRPTSFLGVELPEGSLAFESLKARGLLAAGAHHTAALHPTQLYEAAFDLLLFIFLVIRARGWSRRDRPGVLLCTYLIAYSAARIGLEILREDPDRSYLFRFPEAAPLFLSTSQVLSLALMGVAWLGLKRLERRDQIQLAASLGG